MCEDVQDYQFPICMSVCNVLQTSRCCHIEKVQKVSLSQCAGGEVRPRRRRRRRILTLPRSRRSRASSGVGSAGDSGSACIGLWHKKKEGVTANLKQHSGRHAKYHNHRNQRFCKIFRAWVNFLTKHTVFCHKLSFWSIFCSLHG